MTYSDKIIHELFYLLPHSSAQKLLLVHEFLASILCLFHFANSLFRCARISFRSVQTIRFTFQ